MRVERWPAVLMVILLVASAAWAQEVSGDDRMFQEEFAYRVPNELRPGVELQQVRLNLLRVAPKEGKNIVPGKSIPGTFTAEVENVGRDDQMVMIVALLEDAKGRQLERLELPEFKVKDGKTVTETSKFKVDGQVLRDTAKIWLFFEILE